MCREGSRAMGALLPVVACWLPLPVGAVEWLLLVFELLSVTGLTGIAEGVCD